MKRKTMLELDKKDRLLLYYLDVDGRASYSQLAKKARLSKQVVRYRIERLEKEGIIRGYYAMIDTSKLGYITFRAYLKLRNITPDKREKIVSFLKEQKNIWAVVSLAGKWDIALGIAVKNIYEYHEIWEKILKNCLPNIANYQVSVYSPIYHYSKSYLVESMPESTIRILGGQGKEDINDKDLKILVALSKNARISLLDLSGKIKSTAESISYRSKQLEKKGVIQGYRAMINAAKLGYEFYKAEIRLSSYEQMDSIMDFCHKHPNIYQVDKTIGGETLEVEFHVTSLREMLAVVDEFEKTFPKLIEKFDYITVLSEEKTTYIPEVG